MNKITDVKNKKCYPSALWLIIIIVMIYLAMVWSVTKYGFDTDLLWHLKIGEDILNTKSIFLNNTYSWLQNTIWTQQEWLFGVFLYGIVSIGGIVLFYAIHLFTQFSLIGLSIYKNRYHYDFFAPLLFLLLYLFMPFNQVNRPAEYSTYFFVLMMWLYDKQFKTKPLVYFFIGIILTNFHCGAAVPLLVLMGMLFGLDLLLNLLFHKTNKKPWTLSMRFSIQYISSCLLFLIGLCINPYGLQQIKNMFSVMGLESTKYINEWRPFSSSNYVSWILLFGIAYAFGYALHKHKWNKRVTSHVIILSAFLVLSMASLKGFVLFYYLFIMYGYRYVDEMLYDLMHQIRFKREFQIKKLHIRLPERLTHKKPMYVCIFLLCLFFGVTTAAINQESMDKLITSKQTDYVSSDVIQELVSLSNTAKESEKEFRILNGYVTGNYLLYYDIPMFIDARQQPYSKEFGWSSAVDDYFETDSNDYEAMNTFFDKYDFNYVICNREYNINPYMQQISNAWSLAYTDVDNEIYIWQRIY